MLEVGGELERPRTIPGSKGIPGVVPGNVLTLPYNHDAALSLIRENAQDLACVVMEGVQASAGSTVADRGWAQAVEETCRDEGVVFVLDEVVTGFRLGASGAAGVLGLEPDLVTLAKTIGGGFPIGAVGGRTDLLETTLPDERRERVLVAGTFSGNPMSTAAGLAQLRFLTEDPSHYEHMDAIGERLRSGIRRALDDAGVRGHVTGIGPLWGLHLGTTQHPTTVRESEGFAETGGLALAGYLLREGVLQSAPVHNGYLSAVHTDEDVDVVVEAHRKALRAMVDDGLAIG
jgi:glutamate-1-semialdehyde 2,1-aminomutase